MPSVGALVGCGVLPLVGTSVGVSLGSAVGVCVGVCVGANDGSPVVGGKVLGTSVGDSDTGFTSVGDSDTGLAVDVVGHIEGRSARPPPRHFARWRPAS